MDCSYKKPSEASWGKSVNGPRLSILDEHITPKELKNVLGKQQKC